jgi:hypothetical protein
MKRTVTSLALVVALLGGQAAFAQENSNPSYHYLKTNGLLHGYTNEQLMQLQLQDSYVPTVGNEVRSNGPGQNVIQAPVLVAGPDTTICSGSVTLNATLLAASGQSAGVVNDDAWSGIINIPFFFTFYGNTYNRCLIGSNGEISFNIINANGYNTWPINNPQPSAVPGDLLNTISAPWHDLYPPGGGSIRYATVGTAPNRIFIADWCDVPMFSCTSLRCSQQIQIYEGTNIIETHITVKQLCNTWNAGAAIHSVQNNTGTVSAVVPGQNFPSQYTLNNVGTRFTPVGGAYTISSITFNPIPLANPTITWYANGSPIGTGSTITVSPTVTTDYIAEVSGGCGNLTYRDTATVTVGGSLGNITVTPSAGQICQGGSIQLTATGGTTYMWSPGSSLDDSTIANPTASPSATTTYTVVVGNGSGCTGSTTATVTVAGPGPVVTVAASGGACNSGVILVGWPSSPVILTASASGAVSYLWSTGDTTQAISINTPGIYTVVATDANGCTGSDTFNATNISVNVTCGHNGDKIILCHVPPGNPNNPVTICVAASAIPSHLANHPDDCVGPCSLYYPRTAPELQAIVNEYGFYAEAYPNPSTNSFALHLIVTPDMPVTVNIYDITGRIVETYYNVTEKTQIGSNLATGTYVADVIQGEDHQMLQLVKSN